MKSEMPSKIFQKFWVMLNEVLRICGKLKVQEFVGGLFDLLSFFLLFSLVLAVACGVGVSEFFVFITEHVVV